MAKATTNTSTQPLGAVQVLCEYGYDGEAVEIVGVSINGHFVWADAFSDEQVKRWEDAIALELREEDAALCEQADMWHDAREAA